MTLHRAVAALLTLILSLKTGLFTCHAQTTEFTYQGFVADHGTNFSGAGQFQFALVTSTNAGPTASVKALAPVSGSITGYSILSGGSGYATPPTVSISGGGGSGATATATISGGVVTAVTAVMTGSGYTTSPTVKISAPPLVYTSWWSNDGSSSGGSEPSTVVPVGVTNGLFTVTLGDPAIAGMATIPTSLFAVANLQLQMWFNDGVSGFAAVSPAQNLTPAPSAAFASLAGTALTVSGSVSASLISGTLPYTALPASPGFTGTVTALGFSGDGTSVTNVNAAAVDGLNATNFWRLGGNGIANPASNYLGTANNQPLNLAANAQRALQLVPTTVSSFSAMSLGDTNQNGAPNLIGGSSANTIDTGDVGVVIAGGGAVYYPTNWLGFALPFGYGNSVHSDLSLIGGGIGNTIKATDIGSAIVGGWDNGVVSNAQCVFIGGGMNNRIGTTAASYRAPNDYSAISGGAFNSVTGGSTGGFIGGGLFNTVDENSTASTVSGGAANNISENSDGSTIGGGYGNIVEDDAESATVGGGSNNIAQASGDVIAGGADNEADSASPYSTISGGNGNLIYISQGSVLPGGIYNRINNSDYGFIAGGFENEIDRGASVGNPAGSAIGGGEFNAIYFQSTDAVIGGGSGNSVESGGSVVIGGGYSNRLGNGSDDSVIGGGEADEITTNCDHSVIAGGYLNRILIDAFGSVIGGGESNDIVGGCDHSVIAGGQFNRMNDGDEWCAIDGGQFNQCEYYSAWTTIAGGTYNVSSNAYGGFIAGGGNNLIGGYNSFAGGYNATATNNDCFVWSADGNTTSAQDNSVTFRASGGYRLFTTPATSSYGGSGGGVMLASGATAWTTISDRNAKKNFQPVDTKSVLDKLAAVPIQQWNYKWEKDTDVPNIGPMAQDFKHAFFPGRDDKGITTLEFDGVELAAIQGLNEKLKTKDAEIQALEAKADKVDALEKQVRELAAMVKSLVRKP